MEKTSFAARKSRCMFQSAEERVPQWRSVGSITIYSPEWEHPLHLDGVGYTVFFRGSRRKDELRRAIVQLRYFGQVPWGTLCWWLFLGTVLGFAIGRLYYTVLH